MRSSIQVLALHGFLGLTSDWGGIVGSELLQRGFSLRALDVWKLLPPFQSDMLDCDHANNDFARAAEMIALRSQEIAAQTNYKPILLGYSLGGRLAMHAAARRADLFSAAIFVSAHPGLTNTRERDERLARDQLWGGRFRENDWSGLIADWNAQAVLAPPRVRDQGFVNLHRDEQDFDRRCLAEALDRWSLGRQEDLRASLRQLEIPVLLMSGADDAKFTALCRDLSAGKIHHSVIPRSGHRVPWDAPAAFAQAIAQFASDFGLAK